MRAVVDTGFNGALLLPPTVVRELELRRRSRAHGTLADGDVVSLDVYDATVAWSTGLRTASVLAAGTEALVGMGLLKGHRLSVDVVPGGPLRIVPL